MSRPRRVGYVVAEGDALVLGQPGTRALRLTVDGVARTELGYPETGADPAVREEWRVPWAQVRSLSVEAPISSKRKPGLWPMLGAFVEAAVAGAGDPRTAEVVVRLELDGGPSDADADVDGAGGAAREVACDGYVGKGYWRGDATAIAALLALLVAEPQARAQLDRPERLLEVLAEVGAANPSDEEALATLRTRLL